MLNATLKSISLNKSSLDSISVQIIAEIINDSGYPVKFKILDEKGNVLDGIDNFVATPINISKFFYISKDYFQGTETEFILYMEDESGATSSVSKKIDTFNIENLSRSAVEEFQWSVRNFSTVPIYSIIQVLNNEGEIIYNSNEYKKIYGIDYTLYKYVCNDLLNTSEGEYYYRVKYYSKEENWNRFYPSESGLKLTLRDNTNPRLRIKDTKIRRETDHFVLSSRILISDDEEDDIIYTITDNIGSSIVNLRSYTYSPKLEHLYYEYPFSYFNVSKLTLTVDVNDKLYGKSQQQDTIKLYDLYDFYRERNMFKWKFRNYSNKSIAMQVEVTDFDGKIIKSGQVIRYRNSNNYIDLEDETKFILDRDYYKYHLKVWCDEEDWEEYYPFDRRLEDGIQFTVRKHKDPIVTINECRIYRDLDNIKYLLLKANIKDDPENDQFLFTISDEDGNIIRKARDFIDTPYDLDIKAVYNIIDRTHVNITLAIQDDNNGENIQTVLAPAFQINGLKQDKGHIFSWYVDNYSIQNLKFSIEILKENEETTEEDYIVYRESDYQTIGSTVRPRFVEQRLYPKLPEGSYRYRLKIYSEHEDWTTYYPNEKGYAFSALKNNKPEIEVHSIELKKEEDNKFGLSINGTVTDIDEDLVKLTAKDQYGNKLLDNDFQKTPLDFSINYGYNVSQLLSPRLIVYMDALDEGDALNTRTEIINLFDIQNLYRDYDNFYWLFRNFTNIPIIMQVEILDNEGNLEGAGKEISVGNQREYREYLESIKFDDYDEGNYFFRIRLSTPSETWTSFYPNINGLPFEMIKNNTPIINVDSTNVKRIGSSHYDVSIKATITDKDGNKVYYTIRDDIKE
ncbi:hypothetical protein Goe21_02990 [Bacillus phage vB_BsuM-Goe21]|nr:hypothetical protein Goe21_02990 [Bacillus phage vB_BsuM-Goe21]